MSDRPDSTDLTVSILRDIREEIRRTNTCLDETKTELKAELAQLRDRTTESELRTATALVNVADAVREVKQLLSDRLDLGDRLERCEGEIKLLKEHVGLTT